MNFRSAKNLQKSEILEPNERHLGYEGQRKAIFDGGSADRAVRGEKRFREERGHRGLTRLKSRLCDTGAADLRRLRDTRPRKQ